jgi:glycosyltransferase involved in cell wall biosynthesis
MPTTVSVIMAVYNGERYLREAVESILAQTYPDFEVIIIDDGSSDASAGMLEEFARRDDRVRLVRQENIGLTRTLNKAIELSGGELLARMDADDIAMPDRLRRQVEFMQQHPRVVLLGGAYELIDGRGRLLTRITPPLDDQPLQELALAGRTPICHPLAMMRRDAVLKTGGYDESLKVAQDLDLWLRLGEVGELACLPDVLLKYRQHEESVSEAKQALQVQNTCAWRARGHGNAAESAARLMATPAGGRAAIAIHGTSTRCATGGGRSTAVSGGRRWRMASKRSRRHR